MGLRRGNAGVGGREGAGSMEGFERERGGKDDGLCLGQLR